MINAAYFLTIDKQTKLFTVFIEVNLFLILAKLPNIEPLSYPHFVHIY